MRRQLGKEAQSVLMASAQAAVKNSPLGADPTSALVCREAQFADHERIAALEIRNGLQAKSRADWEYLWVTNPAYRQVQHWPIGWVAETRDRQITAYLGNVPLSYQFHGIDITVATGRAMVADPEYRGSAASLFHRFVRQPGAELIIDSSCNVHSAPIHEALRFTRVPAGDWAHSSFWITDYSGFAAGTLRKRGLPQFFRHAGAFALKMKPRLGKNAPRTNREVEVCTRFDERFEVFWRELQKARHNQLLANRSQKVLEWHFRNALIAKRAWIVTAKLGSKLIAYSIFLRQDNPDLALTRVRLIDFQALQGGTESLESMLAWGVDLCRKQEFHMLEAFGFSPEKQAVIDRLAPFRRRLPAWLYYFKARDKAFSQQLADASSWDPCLYDGDISL